MGRGVRAGGHDAIRWKPPVGEQRPVPGLNRSVSKGPGASLPSPAARGGRVCALGDRLRPGGVGGARMEPLGVLDPGTVDTRRYIYKVPDYIQ